MLAGNVGMDVLDGDGAALSEEEAEARAVENGAAADDAMAVEAADPECGISQHIDGVGDHEQDGVGGYAENIGDEPATDLGVGGGKIEPGLAWFLFGACCDDDDVGAGKDGDVVRSIEGCGGGKHQTVVQVEDFGFDLRLGNIEEADVATDAADHAGVSDGGADAACADDADFLIVFAGHGYSVEIESSHL